MYLHKQGECRFFLYLLQLWLVVLALLQIFNVNNESIVGIVV